MPALRGTIQKGNGFNMHPEPDQELTAAERVAIAILLVTVSSICVLAYHGCSVNDSTCEAQRIK